VAYIHHLRGERAQAVARLREAVARGYSAAKALREPGLAGLVSDPEVARVLEQGMNKHTIPSQEAHLNPGGRP